MSLFGRRLRDRRRCGRLDDNTTSLVEHSEGEVRLIKRRRHNVVFVNALDDWVIGVNNLVDWSGLSVSDVEAGGWREVPS